MDAGLAVAVLLAVAFAVTNGLHDASNAIATLVATRAATPLQAIVLASVFNLLGPLLVGAAVADTIGGIVTVGAVGRHRGDRRRAGGRRRLEPASPGGSGCRRAPATRWSAASSARRSLEGGIDAVNWGGLDGLHPVGVFGTLIALAVSPPARRARRAARDPRACAGSRGGRRGAGAARCAAGSG